MSANLKKNHKEQKIEKALKNNLKKRKLFQNKTKEKAKIIK